MTRITIGEIREVYSNPVTSGFIGIGTRYCVGSAFLQACNICIGWPFPDVLTLADGLQIYNADLDQETAIDFAEFIIRFNDTKDFNAAWDTLKDAIEYNKSIF